jgi:hypothetical protein
MIYIPFIYFSILLSIILTLKRRFELDALITSAFAITSFFAILIDSGELYGSAGAIEATISIAPTFLYILLITISIIPFYYLPILKNDKLIKISNLKIFNYIIYFYMLIAVLLFAIFSGEILNRLQNSDLAQLRNLYASGEDDLGFSQLSGIERIIARSVFILGSEAMLLQILYFYSLAKMDRSFKFNFGILICSILPVIISMLSFDRSKIIYWALSYIALMTFFWPALQNKSKRIAKQSAFILLSPMLLYLSFITISRYGEQDVGGYNSFIVYAGQSFNNFCLFYDKISYIPYNFDKITPIFNYILSLESQQTTLRNPIDLNVFASFIGIIFREIGLAGLVFYIIIYFSLTLTVIKNIKVFSVFNIIVVISLLYIPYLGIFGIYYGNLQKEISTWIAILIGLLLQKKHLTGKNKHLFNNIYLKK